MERLLVKTTFACLLVGEMEWVTYCHVIMLRYLALGKLVCGKFACRMNGVLMWICLVCCFCLFFFDMEIFVAKCRIFSAFSVQMRLKLITCMLVLFTDDGDECSVFWTPPQFGQPFLKGSFISCFSVVFSWAEGISSKRSLNFTCKKVLCKRSLCVFSETLFPDFLFFNPYKTIVTNLYHTIKSYGNDCHEFVMHIYVLVFCISYFLE